MADGIGFVLPAGMWRGGGGRCDALEPPLLDDELPYPDDTVFDWGVGGS